MLIGVVWVAAGVTGWAASADGAQSASLLEGQPTVEIVGKALRGGGWSYEGEVGVGAQVRIVSTALPGGGTRCAASLALAPGQTGVAVEQRDDLGKCFVTLLPADGTTEASEQGGSSAYGAGRGAAGSTKGGGEVTTAATRRSEGYHLTWFEDPVDRDVNKVKNTINWHWDGSKVSSYTASYYWWWRSGTAWKKEASAFGHGFADKRTYAFGNSYVHYKNTIFCATTDTDVWYDRNRVRVYGNGTLWGTCEWRKLGKCAWMLHVYYELKRTLD